MKTNTETFKILDTIRINFITKIENDSKEIIERTFKEVIEAVNNSLTVPLEGFLIRGMTPYFNDGEECTHSYDIALPSISLDSNNDYDLFERNDMFELMFSDYKFYEEFEIEDSYDYKQLIRDGVLQPIFACTDIEEAEIAEHGVSIINTVLEKTMITNYIAVAKLQSDGTYSFTYNHFEPDY